MEKFSLEPVFNVLQVNVNTTLSVFAKKLIENNDYSTLAKIAEIGEKTNSFFYNLSDTIHGYTAQSVNDEEKIIDAEEVNPKTPKSKFKYSVAVQETKTWIYNYLGKRGGTALIEDLLSDFHKEFSNRFTDEELSEGKWRDNIFHRASELRKVKGKVINLLEPTHGRRSDYYSLSAHGLKTYNAELSKLEEKNYQQLSMKEMSG